MYVFIQTEFRAVLTNNLLDFTFHSFTFRFVHLLGSLWVYLELVAEHGGVMPFETFSALPPGLQQLIQGKRAPREPPVPRRPLCNPRVPRMALGTSTAQSQFATPSLGEITEGEKHETLTWKFRFLAAAAHIAAFAAWQLLPKCCCRMDLFFFFSSDYIAVRSCSPSVSWLRVLVWGWI